MRSRAELETIGALYEWAQIQSLLHRQRVLPSNDVAVMITCAALRASAGYPHIHRYIPTRRARRATLHHMAKVYIEGQVAFVEDASFNDKKTGGVVPYFGVYVLDEDRKMLRLGSKSSEYEKFVGSYVIITAELKPDFEQKNLFRLSILQVKAAK